MQIKINSSFPWQLLFRISGLRSLSSSLSHEDTLLHYLPEALFLAFAFSSIFHFKIIFSLCCEVGGHVSFIVLNTWICNCSGTVYDKQYPSPALETVILVTLPNFYKCMGLFLSSLFFYCPIFLFFINITAYVLRIDFTFQGSFWSIVKSSGRNRDFPYTHCL